MSAGASFYMNGDTIHVTTHVTIHVTVHVTIHYMFPIIMINHYLKNYGLSNLTANCVQF